MRAVGAVRRGLPRRASGRYPAAAVRTGTGQSGPAPPVPDYRISERYTADDLGWAPQPHTPCGQ